MAPAAAIPKPIPLITFEYADINKSLDEGRFVVNPEAAAQLAQLPRPLHVVTIAGLYRTGKSFVLNQLAGFTDGFNIGASVEPCTEGIWMWMVNKEKTDLSAFGLPADGNVVLLDTEGLGSTNRTETYHVQLFALSLLLSSYFIYNSLGSIDESAIDRLSLVTQLSQHIQTSAEAPSAANLQMFFPSFLWLVRDFTLELVAGGRTISSRGYLESALAEAKGDPGRVASKNAIRKTLLSFFPDRDCFTMKRPVDSEQLLHRLGELKLSEFRPEYVRQMEELKELVLSRVKPKTMFGELVNGQMLANLAEQYVDAINSGQVPTIHSAWENVVHTQGIQGLKEAKEAYQSGMADARERVMDEEELAALHRSCEARALAVLRSRAVGAAAEALEAELGEYVGEELEAVQQSNRKRSKEACEELMQSLSSEINSRIAGGQIDGMEQLADHYDQVVHQYRKRARGPAKHLVLADHLVRRQINDARKVAAALVAKAEQEGQEKLQAQLARKDDEYKRLNELFESVNGEWKRAQEENKTLGEYKKHLEERLIQAADWM